MEDYPWVPFSPLLCLRYSCTNCTLRSSTQQNGKNTSQIQPSTAEVHKGFTLLELIVVLTIIGTLSLLIAPSFRISDESVESKFSPFITFIEQQRNKVIASGKPTVLELEKSGILRIQSLQKDAKNKYPITAEVDVEQFTFMLSTGDAKKGRVLFYPNGTLEAFSLQLPNITKQLVYNGTVARGVVK